MSKDKDTRADTPADDEAPGGRRKLLLVGLAVLLVAAGAAWFLLVSGGSAEAEEPVPGEVLTLEPVAVNLAGGGYLKIGITLQLTEDAAGGHGGAPDGAKALDLVISTFSQAQPADVTGAREALKEALEQRIVEAYHGAVIEIYYTEYVTP